MKVIRWCGALYLIFLLWLLLFPPWVHLPYGQVNPDSAVIGRLGHHWRFTVPLDWAWDEHVGSVLKPDIRAIIDYRLTRYEAVIGLVAASLLVLLFPMLEALIRSTVSYSKSHLPPTRNP